MAHICCAQVSTLDPHSDPPDVPVDAGACTHGYADPGPSS
jgi:hypothetical protein